jgi:hypothetical protein
MKLKLFMLTTLIPYVIVFAWYQSKGECLRVLEVSDIYLYSITALNDHDDTLAVAADNGCVYIVSLQHGVLQTIDTPLKKTKTAWGVCAIDNNR